jgi:outer membrane protein OmpA-like peptidoglycan-associated protein
VTGYTDATVQPDGEIANETLARERALVVKDYLTDRGVSVVSIEMNARALCCYVADNDSESGRRLNRRATIELLP